MMVDTKCMLGSFTSDVISRESKKKTCTRLKWPKIFDTSVTINFYKDQGHDGKRPAVLSLR